MNAIGNSNIIIQWTAMFLLEGNVTFLLQNGISSFCSSYLNTPITGFQAVTSSQTFQGLPVFIYLGTVSLIKITSSLWIFTIKQNRVLNLVVFFFKTKISNITLLKTLCPWHTSYNAPLACHGVDICQVFNITAKDHNLNVCAKSRLRALNNIIEIV